MRLAPLLLLCSCSLFALTGCPSDDDGDVPDNGVGNDAADSGPLDAKLDSGVNNDAEPLDGDAPDTAGMDASDSGMIMPGVTLLPGTGVLIDANRIEIGVDTFDSVNAKLVGIPRVRMPQDSVRSYEYTFPNYVVTIWYANTNLDMDGMAPMDVDGSDQVLWIAVEDGFVGTTPEDIGLDSTRADVEGAYGPPPHTVVINNPMGTLSQYYTTGILVAYEPNDDVRTITISRAYLTEPNGEIDPPGRRAVFGANEIKGLLAQIPPDLGTQRTDVLALLGPPDVTGTVELTPGNMADTLSYGFIGIEVFFTEGGNRTIFLVLHAPYYGTTSTGLGMGTPRADMETYLTGLGFNGTVSSNPQFFCYDDGTTMVGVTYTMADNLVSSITLALPSCP